MTKTTLICRGDLFGLKLIRLDKAERQDDSTTLSLR